MKTYILTDEVQAIGNAGEQGGISVAVDVSTWQAEYADGIGAMLCERPDGRPVPLSATVTDNLLLAVLPQECTSRPGQYVYKATWTQAGVLRISHSYKALILTTENGRGIPPDKPGTPAWATEIFVKAEQIDAALDAAMQLEQFAKDAEDAKDAAEDAQDAAEDAQEAAEEARDRAEAAATMAQEHSMGFSFSTGVLTLTPITDD